MQRSTGTFLIAFNAVLMAGASASAQVRDASDGKWREQSSARTGLESVENDEAAMPVPIVVRPDAQDPAPASEALDIAEGIRIGSVLIEAPDVIDHALFEKSIEPFLGAEAGPEDLARLTQEIADVARAQGLVLATAYIPPQDVELGIVRVVLMIGVIDEVRILGSQNQALKDLLQPLVGEAVIQRELERRLMLASDIPSISAKQAEFITEDGRYILVVTVEERKKTSGQFVADNSGSKAIGPLRGRMTLNTIGWLAASDALSATVQTNPSDTDELLSASLAYGFGLNNQGTRAGATIAASRSKLRSSYDFSRQDITSQYVSMVVNHPLRRLRGSSAWLEGQIEYLEFEQEREGALLVSDTVVTLSTSLSSLKRTGNGWLRSGLQLRRGLDTPGSSQPGSALSSRYDASGEFTSARAWINWSASPSDDWAWRLWMTGQYTDDPLLLTEEIGFGGTGFGRGFEPYTFTGDRGILALAELGYAYDKPVDWLGRLEPYAFVDYGYLDQIGDGLGGDRAMSGGGGVRAEIGRVGVQLETAVPVFQDVWREAKDEPKLNFQLGLDF